MKKRHFLTTSLIVGTFCLSGLLSSCELKSSPSDAARYIPIQHRGQIKSLDSFSRETVELVTGKERWEKKSPTSVILEGLYRGDDLQNTPWIMIDSHELISHLGLPLDQKHFSYQQLIPVMSKIQKLVQDSQTKRNEDLRPSKLEQKAELLFSRALSVKNLLSGKSIQVIPTMKEDIWVSPYRLDSPLSDSFKALVESLGGKKYEDFDQKVEGWLQKIHKVTENKYLQKTNLEIRYYNMRPFEHAWIAYLLAFLILTLLGKRQIPRYIGTVLFSLAVFFHAYGLVLRTLILSRPPVSNMYESMVFMNLALILFAIVFSIIQKNLIAIKIGSLISAAIMIYANLLPMDASLGVLVPVLRSNYWLTIHVLTVVASYGAFGLAMGLGHRHLFLQVRKKIKKKEQEKSSDAIYRVMQVGILLLGIGTVLGGVWANESWGRFWGWDPKETWALITLLGYLLIVHLRYSKNLKPFGLAVSSILGFMLVLMTWYGVNFVLGRGLHSYGQGSGGTIWVIYYLIFEVLFLGYIFIKKIRN